VTRALRITASQLILYRLPRRPWRSAHGITHRRLAGAARTDTGWSPGDAPLPEPAPKRRNRRWSNLLDCRCCGSAPVVLTELMDWLNARGPLRLETALLDLLPASPATLAHSNARAAGGPGQRRDWRA
jgi:hypothetical protein